jgi:glycosyltransferase involved in cell wall biosynthesis
MTQVSAPRRVSVVIRTLNESRHLPDLLRGIRDQEVQDTHVETVLVDSGSTDGTLEIAEDFGARIVHIRKEDFSFGRSLNYGCDAATGDALVMVSGHCIPVDRHWIKRLVAPLGKDGIAYAYGGQHGGPDTRFSEKRIFAKYFPDTDHLPQEGFFCNNANSALLKSVWSKHAFDEQLTGLEDMHLAKVLVENGHRIGYVAGAAVYHLHDESWAQVRRRFEREAIALQRIMPEVHLSRADVLRYFLGAVLHDFGSALNERCFRQKAAEILTYRFMQFTGSYRGNHSQRLKASEMKEQYFYPSRRAQSSIKQGNQDGQWKTTYRGAAADEGK